VSFKHKRDDPRIFRRMCQGLHDLDTYEVHLLVSDERKMEIKEGVEIDSIKLSKQSLFRFVFVFVPLLIAYVKNKSFHVIHFHDPEFLIVAPLLKLMGLKLIYDAHEPYSSKLRHNGENNKFIRYGLLPMFLFIETIGLRFVNAVVVPQPFMKTYFEAYNCTTEIIRNYPLSKSKVLEKKIDNQDTFIKGIYAGSITEERGIWELLDNLADLPNFELTICGPCKPSLLESIKSHKNWENVEYLGNLNEKELTQVYLQNHLGIIFFRDIGQYRTTGGLKTFEYMANGLALLLPEMGDWPKFNKKYKLGYCVNTLNGNNIKTVIGNLSKKKLIDIGQNNYKTQQELFSFETELKVLHRLYQKLS